MHKEGHELTECQVVRHICGGINLMETEVSSREGPRNMAWGAAAERHVTGWRNRRAATHRSTSSQ